MKIELNEKTYIASKPKAKHFRQALVISRDYDLEDISPDVLDDLVQYVCDVFGNKFDLEDFYDHIDANEMIPVVLKTINFVANGMTEEEKKKKIKTNK